MSGTYAGEVERRRNRQSGTTVVLLDRDNGGDWVDADERWVTLCDEHSTTCGHETRLTARYFVATPEEWCEECRTALPPPVLNPRANTVTDRAHKAQDAADRAFRRWYHGETSSSSAAVRLQNEAEERWSDVREVYGAEREFEERSR